MMILIVSSSAEVLMRATAFSVPEIICQQTLTECQLCPRHCNQCSVKTLNQTSVLRELMVYW